MPEPVRRLFGFAFPYWTISAPAELLLGRLQTDDFLRGMVVLSVTALLLQALAFVGTLLTDFSSYLNTWAHPH